MDRRTFLLKGIGGLALMGAGPLLAACAGTGRVDLPLPDLVQPKAATGLDTVRRRILAYAALAPSGHNSQPWAVRIAAADEWIVEMDPARRLPAVDPENREALLAIGAFAENLAIAAGAAGLDSEMAVLADSAADRDVLRVRLAPGRPSGYPLARLEARRTLRHGMRPDPLRPNDVAALAAPLDGRLFYFPPASAHAACLREGAVEHFRSQSLRDDAQRELTRWLRLSRREAETHRDGLTVEGMEITGVKGWFVRRFVAPEDFMRPKLRAQGIEMTARLAAEGGGWIVITSAGRRVADLVDTGRRFERMALLARERGIALHPMTQYLEEPAGQRRIAAAHPESIVPQFVLRVGYVDRYPDPVSLRRPVADFLRAS